MEESAPSAAAAAGVGLGLLLVWAILYVAFTALMFWKVFVKAGQPGWASIVPIYNLIVLLQIAGRPLWWIIFFVVPCLNMLAIVFIIIVDLDVAKAFGKSVPFAIGMIFLPIIFYPIIGFGSAQYQGAAPAALKA